MKKLRKILCFVIPCFLVIAITLGVVLPLTLNRDDKKRVSGFESALADETGASTAEKKEKGGAIYLEENSTYYMAGGTISGSKNTYGGAVFVSSGATFTMEGGTITGCNAKYGGAVYVASGGICVINGGKIVDNTAEVAPAIYVEEGGHLTIVGDSEIAENTVGKWIPFVFGEPEKVSDSAQSTLKMRTFKFGSMPQDYVGDSLNAELESWYSQTNPQAVDSFSSDDIYHYDEAGDYAYANYRWDCYNYKGEKLARTQAKTTGSSGDFVVGNYYWFRVKPIVWFALNYDEWLQGGVKLFAMSKYLILYGINVGYKTGPWESSSNYFARALHRFYANKFVPAFFTTSEAEYIASTLVNNDKEGSSDYSYAFNLSITELEKYLPLAVDRICGYERKTNLCDILSYSGYYATRDRNSNKFYTTVIEDGSFYSSPNSFTSPTHPILFRPVMWLDI